MIRLSLIGNGNLGSNLIRAFCNTPSVDLVEVVDRKATEGPHKLGYTQVNDPQELQKVDLCLLAVPDDMIGPVAGSLPDSIGMVAHCSGAASLEVLPSDRPRGVWYPLQSFSQGRQVDLGKVPICIEASSSSGLELLQIVGDAVSSVVRRVDSNERAELHLAAVWVNNFVNHLYHLASSRLHTKELSLDLLGPLMQETLDKLQYMSPEEAQTGPAMRGDFQTIQKHLSLLGSDPAAEVYQKLTQSIAQLYGNKL